jgi:OFA family oxalate/formate antiporter-like MFS transporter
MLTAWGVAGVLGPTLIAQIRQATGHYTEALHVIAAIMLASAVIPLLVRPLEGATSAFVPPYQPQALGRKA